MAIERPPPGPGPSTRGRRGGRGLRGHAQLGFDADARLRALNRHRPHDLERLGLSVPDEMSGEPIEATGELDPGFVERLEDRLAAVGPRRGPVIGVSLLIWVGLALLAAVAWRAPWPARGAASARGHGRLSAGGAAADAALQPSELAERLIAGVGPPALALATLRLASPYGGAGARRRRVRARLRDRRDRRLPAHRALAAGAEPGGWGCASSGSATSSRRSWPRSSRSPPAPALAAWAPRISPRGAALAFAATGLVAVAAFAAGAVRRRRRRRDRDSGRSGGGGGRLSLGVPPRTAARLIAARSSALAVLGAADLLLGGDAHLTRSVLRGRRRSTRSPTSPSGACGSPREASAATPPRRCCWIARLLIVGGIVQRRRIEAWFGDRRTALGGPGGSGAPRPWPGRSPTTPGRLLLMIGTALCAADRGPRLGHAQTRHASPTCVSAFGNLGRVAGIVSQAGSSLPSRPASSRPPARVTGFAIARTHNSIARP